MTVALASRQPTLEPENGEPLALRWVPLNSLRAFGRKARTHSKDQIRKIADSIKAFGFSVPIMIDDDNRILAGNGRIEAARILGMETVPVVVMSHLSDAQKRAFVVAENRLAELAGWDRGILQAELRELAELNLNFDLAVIGFDDAQIEALVLEGDAGLARADTVPPLQQTAVCQPGDVWLPLRPPHLSGTRMLLMKRMRCALGFQ